MIPSPSGTGSRVNLTIVPASNTDLYANAQAENAKNALALIADSLKTVDVSFVEHRAYRYDNQKSSPALAPPLQQVRVLVESQRPSTETWQQKYEELVAQLPEEVKTWLNEEYQLPYYQRDLEFFAFHALLATLAQGQVWLAYAVAPIPTDSAAAERAQANLLMPYLSAKAAVLQGKEIVSESFQMWQEIGRNDPNFDKNVNYLNQTQNIMHALEEVELSDQQGLRQIGDSIEQLKSEYHNTSAGKDLQIIGHTIDALSLVASSLQIGFGPASALWTLSLCAQGMPHTQLQSLSGQLTEALTPGANAGQKKLLGESMTTLLTLTLATALPVAENGLAYMPKLDPDSDKALRSMTLVLTAHTLLASGILPNAYNALAAKITEDPKAQELIKNGATLANLVLIIMSLEGKEGLSETLFHSLRTGLQPLFDQMSAQLEPDAAPQLKIYLQQAKIALDNNDYGGFKSTYDNLLASFNISSNSLQNEFKEIGHLGLLIKEAVINGPEDATNRVTTMQAA